MSNSIEYISKTMLSDSPGLEMSLGLSVPMCQTPRGTSANPCNVWSCCFTLIYGSDKTGNLCNLVVLACRYPSGCPFWTPWGHLHVPGTCCFTLSYYSDQAVWFWKCPSGCLSWCTKLRKGHLQGQIVWPYCFTFVHNAKTAYVYTQCIVLYDITCFLIAWSYRHPLGC